ncbi:MAG TPA: hypothetical protein VLT61_01710 [Anaeromyxobacteraceae bacterium]|nr:hypothetical protein [Anaeromyxobacteraceae bacterium]
MTRKNAWSPAEGPDAAPQQIPPHSGRVSGDGDDDRRRGLWAPSEGPVRSDPGGPGGEPDGKTISKPGRTALNEGLD